MYIEKKKIGNHEYLYLKTSTRVKNKVKTKTVGYLGKAPMKKSDIKEKINQLQIDYNNNFLSKEQTKNLKKLQSDFQKKLKNLDKSLLLDMLKDFKTYYIYNTNTIEGNTLTLQETNLLLNENKTPAGHDLREIYDHTNERDVFDFLFNNKPKLDIKLIIKIHGMLLNRIDNRTGKFRDHDVRVFGADFNTSSAKYVQTDMKILMNWLNSNNKKLNPLILSAIFHEKFEKIHPFYDGNGRTGRMLSNLILLHHEMPLVIIENKKRKKYFEVLSIAHKSDLTKVEIQHYRSIVQFFYDELITTYEQIFSKWG